MKQIRRYHLAHLPTPLEPMHRLSAALGGPRLWIKRDDQTGLATGGNKTRKLEFLVAEALAQKAGVVLTVGAAQSNHCRQTAAAAAKVGLDCALVLRGTAPARSSGAATCSCTSCWAPSSGGRATASPGCPGGRGRGRARAGRRPSCSASAAPCPRRVGLCLGLQRAVGTDAGAGLSFDRIVFASSSGGTHAGLVVGARECGCEGQVLGISVDKTGGHLRQTVVALLAPTAERLGWDLDLGPADVQVEDGYLGAGYGVVTPAEREAVRLVACTEGILLDPVYTGKAMAGLIDLVRSGQIGAGETVLFWHTGGIPALFAYAADLLAE